MMKNKIIKIEEETKVGNFILEKGDKIEVLTEDYGWEIQRGQEYAALEDAIEVMGAEEVLNSLAAYMKTDELNAALGFIFKNWDYDSPYLIS